MNDTYILLPIHKLVYLQREPDLEAFCKLECSPPLLLHPQTNCLKDDDFLSNRKKTRSEC